MKEREREREREKESEKVLRDNLQSSRYLNIFELISLLAKVHILFLQFASTLQLNMLFTVTYATL